MELRHNGGRECYFVFKYGPVHFYDLLLPGSGYQRCRRLCLVKYGERENFFAVNTDSNADSGRDNHTDSDADSYTDGNSNSHADTNRGRNAGCAI